MKIFIVFAVLVATTSSRSGCDAGVNIHYCSKIDLKADESLNLNITLSELFIVDATGSIGAQTFSNLTPVKELRIESSKINSIEDGALCASTNLEGLTIRLNKEFPVLTSSLFINCDKLKYIAIEEATLEKTAFDNMPNLETLYLTHLDLPHFSKEYLQSLKHLKRLVISECKLGQIDAGVMCTSPELKTLELNFNDFLPTLSESIFENCEGVEKFQFICPVKYYKIPEGVFSSFASLKSARFHKVDLENLSKDHLRGLNSLENLRIENSYIGTIDKDAFEGLTKLTELSLRNDNISQIQSELFTPLTRLNELVLSHNEITSIDNIRHSRLQHLEAISIGIRTVDPKAVRINLPNLYSLNLIGNNITREYGAELNAKLEGIMIRVE